MAEENCCNGGFWMYLIASIALVVFAGLMSGLTLGLMSLGLLDLEVLAKSGQPDDRKYAAKILPVVKNQHLLLCTLLVGNAMAMEALPIFLDALVPAWGSVLISVTLILIFGEILPQAICTRYGLKIGAALTPFVRVLLLLFLPVTYPVSKLLDWLLGKGHFVLLRREELKALVDIHGIEAGKGGELTQEETNFISGALEMTKKTVGDGMMPIDAIFSLDFNAKLDMKTMDFIIANGHSRVPIYFADPTNIIGFVLVKNLMKYRPEDETPIRNLTIRKTPWFPENMPLFDVFKEFQRGHSHIAIVVKERKNGNAIRTNELRIKVDKKTTNTRENRRVNSEPVAELRTVDDQGGKNKSRATQHNAWERNELDSKLEMGHDSFSKLQPDVEVVGIITMEDVIEELLQEEILDETDKYVDVHKKINVTLERSPLSSGSCCVSQNGQMTRSTSPLTSCRYTPMLRSSSASSYLLTYGRRSILSVSPSRFLARSPYLHAYASLKPNMGAQ